MGKKYRDPITGKLYDTIPENFILRSDLSPEAEEYVAQKENERLLKENEKNPFTLDELIVYNLPTNLTDEDLISLVNSEHRRKVAEADARVKETSAFEKPLNFLSPSQYFGAAVDYFLGESPFWLGVYNGNSGFVPDNFAEQYPVLSALLNMAGDAAFGKVVAKGKPIINSGINRGLKSLGYTKELPLNPNNYYRVVGPEAIEDAISSNLIRSKTGWYHGSLDNTLHEFGEYLTDFTRDQLRKMGPNEVLKIIEERMKLAGKPRSIKVGMTIRPSTNHGNTVGFTKGKLFYDPVVDDAVIEGTPQSAKYAVGHHGKVKYDAPINYGDAVVMLDHNTGVNRYASVPLNSGFSYYTQEPILNLPYFRNIIYWKHNKFK